MNMHFELHNLRNLLASIKNESEFKQLSQLMNQGSINR